MSITDTENKLMVTKGESGGGGGINWEFGIYRCILLYIKIGKKQGPTT